MTLHTPPTPHFVIHFNLKRILSSILLSIRFNLTRRLQPSLRANRFDDDDDIGGGDDDCGDDD